MAFNVKILSVVLVLVIVASVSGYLIGSGQRIHPRATSTTAVTSTSVVTHTILTHEGLFELSFVQTGVCPSDWFVSPWAVTLSNGMSMIKPPNSNVSDTAVSITMSPQTIAFYVTSGNYTFQVRPNDLFPIKGTVTVDNQNTVVQVGISILSCGTSTASEG
jgi:hypothetical protein